MTDVGIGVLLILGILIFFIFWALGEFVREPWDDGKWTETKQETPQYVVYRRTLKKTCENTTIFGKIIIGGIITIFVGPSVIIIPIMHFIRDVFKAAMFK